MPEHAVVEQELGASRSLQVEDPRKGNSEEADTIVARHFPKHRKGCDRGRHRHRTVNLAALW